MSQPSGFKNPVYIAIVLFFLLAPVLVVMSMHSSGDEDSTVAASLVSERTKGPATLPSVAAPVVATASVPTSAPTTAPAVAAAPTVPPTHAFLEKRVPVSSKALNEHMAAAVRNAVGYQYYECSQVCGGAFADTPFQDVCPDGVLIGLNIGLGKFFNQDTIKMVQPIYLTPAGEKFGRAHGRSTDRIVQAKAPPGYAIGGLKINGGGGLDGIKFNFMPISGAMLNHYYISTTDRVGGPGGGETDINGNGIPIIGICGKTSKDHEWLGMGVVYLHPKPKER